MDNATINLMRRATNKDRWTGECACGCQDVTWRRAEQDGREIREVSSKRSGPIEETHGRAICAACKAKYWVGAKLPMLPEE